MSEEQQAGNSSDSGQTDASQLSMLLNIDVVVTVEMGTTSMKLKDLLNLNKNAIVELDKSAGEPLDIKANGSLIARGEVVVANNRYGIRLTEVVSKKERMENI